jgi:hypothetical protein
MSVKHRRFGRKFEQVKDISSILLYADEMYGA